MEQREIDTKIQEHMTYLKEELVKIRTGRANVSLIEDIQVEVYGSRQALKGLGTIHSLDPQTLVVEPWDKDALEPVATAITKAQNGLTAIIEGGRVRVPFPHLSEERRQEFIKQATAKAEETKIKLRRLRDEAMKELDTQEKLGDISEDDKFSQKKKLEETFKKQNEEIEELKNQKGKELASI